MSAAMVKEQVQYAELDYTKFQEWRAANNIEQPSYRLPVDLQGHEIQPQTWVPFLSQESQESIRELLLEKDSFHQLLLLNNNLARGKVTRFSFTPVPIGLRKDPQVIFRTVWEEVYTNYLCKKLSESKIETLQALFESECQELMILKKDSSPEMSSVIVDLESLFTAE